jgi:hypothetical protein
MRPPAPTNRATTTVNQTVDDSHRAIGTPGRERRNAGSVGTAHGTPLGFAR